MRSSCWRFSVTSGSEDFNAASWPCNFSNAGRLAAGLLPSNAAMISSAVYLTLALMHQPDVLLLDEPYQGFDWETYLHFWELAEDLRSQGRAVLVISHLLFDQQRFDALYQLENGQLTQLSIDQPREMKGV